MTVIWVGALLIGFTLGLLGSGGSAITVPVLVYLVGHDAKQSIAESMAIVGLISAVAAIPYARQRQIDWRSVLYFGVPGMLGTFAGAYLGGLAAGALQLAVFGGVLVAAAAAMLWRPRSAHAAQGEDREPLPPARLPTWKIAAEGSAVGVLTGFVGVGGGFLIVPALVLLGRLPMRIAVGTSLVVIAIKAVVGFAKYEHYLLSQDMSVDLPTVAVFVVIGIVGSLAGKLINARMNQRTLQTAFAVFLVLIGAAVMVREGARLARPAAARGVEPAGRLAAQDVPPSGDGSYIPPSGDGSYGSFTPRR